MSTRGSRREPTDHPGTRTPLAQEPLTPSERRAIWRPYAKALSVAPFTGVDAQGYALAPAQSPPVVHLAQQLEHNPDWQRLVRGLAGGARPGSHPDEPHYGHTSAQIVSDFLRDWNAGYTHPGDKFAVMYAFHRAAAMEFGLDVRDIPAAYASAVRQAFEPYMPGLRAMVRAMYDETQAAFRKAGVRGTIEVLRTMSQGDLRRKSSGLYSATADDSIVQTLSRDWGQSAIYRTRVPVSRVLSFAGTGLGWNGQAEWVILGGTDTWRRVAVEPGRARSRS